MRSVPPWCFVLASVACQSRSAPVQPLGSAPSIGPAASAPAAAAERTVTTPGERELDSLFHGFEQRLPEATTLSEANGATLTDCESFGGVTYTRLQGIARRSAPSEDAVLPGLVKWARHHNACIRQIAIEMLLLKIGHDRNSLSAPGMHEPEDHHFHDIMVTLLGYLAKKQVPYDPAIFSGLMLELKEQDFPAFLRGTWTEVETPRKNFVTIVEADAVELRVTSKHTTRDPKSADYTWTTKVGTIARNERRQFVVTGVYNVESNNQGYQGKKVEPSQFVYTFWPVAPGVVWFKNGEHAYWEKLTKAVK